MTSPSTSGSASASPVTTASATSVAGATKAPEPEKSSATTEVVAAQVEATSDVESPKTKVVRLKGASGVGFERIITEEDWKSIGVKDQETVQWDIINGYSIPASEFTDSALRYLDKVDHTLEVVEVDDDAPSADED